jgi:hypothetical protein
LTGAFSTGAAAGAGAAVAAGAAAAGAGAGSAAMAADIANRLAISVATSLVILIPFGLIKAVSTISVRSAIAERYIK